MAPRNFLFIIGTAKAGTSALSTWLDARDDMTVGDYKEPRYFSDFAEKTWTGVDSDFFAETIPKDEAAYFEWYHSIKPGADWAIDASTDYLWCQCSPDRIAAFKERYNAKLICMVRDPVDRAISQYRHAQRDMYGETLREALDREPERIAAGWQPVFWHVRRSKIHDDLTRYAERFGKDLLIVDYSELADPDRLLAKVSDFLGIPFQPIKVEEKQNQTILPKNSLVKAIWANPVARQMGRVLVPKPLRRAAYGWTHSTKVKAFKPEEIAYLRSLLREEIDACVASPLIPTSTWRRALGQTRQNT
jgi:Sulfotransferase family